MSTPLLGRIKSAKVGMGGYQGAMFGVSVQMGGDSWSVSDFWGFWSMEPDGNCKWTKATQSESWADACRRLIDLLRKAKCDNVEDLTGIPVRVYLKGSVLHHWEILEEVL